MARGPALVTRLESASQALGVPVWAVCGLVCALVYTVGIVLSLAEGEFEPYIHYIVTSSLTLWLFSMMVLVVWGHREYARVIWAARECFENDKFDDRLRLHWRTLCDPLTSWLAEGVGGGASVCYVLCARYFRQTILIPSFSRWIVYGNGVMYCYLQGLGAVTCGVTALAAILYFHHMLFIWGLRDFDPVHKVFLARETNLKDLAKFSFYGSATGFLALAFFSAVLFQDLTGVTLAIYSAIGMGILAAFIIPQVHIHQTIAQSKLTVLEALRKSLPAHWERIPFDRLSPETKQTLNLIAGVDAIDEWPIQVHIILLEVAAATLPVLAGTLGSLFAFVR